MTLRLCVSLLLVLTCLSSGVAKISSLEELDYYEIVGVEHVGRTARNRGDLSTFLPEENKHLDETTFEFSGHNRQFSLHIYKNKHLISDSFRSIYQNKYGTYHFDNTIEHCYYHGYLGDRVTSSASVTTCYGLSGVILDEDGEQFLIEPHPYQVERTSNPNKHILYKSKDIALKKVISCGINHTDHSHRLHNDYYGTHLNVNSPLNGLTAQEHKRSRGANTDTKEHHRSRRASTDTKYIEVIIILDKLMFDKHKTVNITMSRGLEIMNIVDAYYKTVNTRTVVANVMVWNVANNSTVSKSAGETLDALEIYARDEMRGKLELNFDTAQLIHGENWGTLGGLAGVGVMCTFTSSAVTADHGAAHQTANTLAHEMGHNIGLMHDTSACTCTTPPCVMSSAASSQRCRGFSSCSQEKYEKNVNDGDLACLFNYPRIFFQDAKCGNGLLEEGEHCDCGSKEECEATNSDKCCEFSTCKLKASSVCAIGPCCENCKYKKKG